MAGNSNLASAMGAKQDEFYTQLRTIEDELRHYRKHFKGKTVLCNCDDPFESNFFKYFALNFNKLEGDGDFRSRECLELLDEADIVATNPPFSLFREYLSTLIDHDKKFVIIGNQNTATLSVMQSTRFPARRSTWPAANSMTLSGSWISPREAATSVAASPLIS